MILKVKKRENPYAQIDKDLLHDARLSFKAKGILCYLLSKPDDWQCKVKDIVNHGTEGRDAVYSAMKELKETGYIKTVVIQGTGGRLLGRAYEVHETPIPNESADSTEIRVSRNTEKPKDGKTEIREIPTLTNKECTNKEFTNKEGDREADRDFNFSKFWELYDKKQDRKKCLAKWKRLKQSERDEILRHLPSYIDATPEVQYRKNPLTYLNGRTWEDEYLPTPRQSFAPRRQEKQGLNDFIHGISH